MVLFQAAVQFVVVCGLVYGLGRAIVKIFRVL